jgi:hypothetical protein
MHLFIELFVMWLSILSEKFNSRLHLKNGKDPYSALTHLVTIMRLFRTLEKYGCIIDKNLKLLSVKIEDQLYWKEKKTFFCSLCWYIIQLYQQDGLKYLIWLNIVFLKIICIENVKFCFANNILYILNILTAQV